MNELSLFSGAGGGLLATKHLLGWNTIGYVEYEPYCQEVLKARIKDGYLDAAPIFGDIRAFIADGYAAAYKDVADVITAGFPCQPFSVAGKQRGADDERNMWPFTRDTIRIVRPRYALLENVPGLLNSGYFSRILSDLHEIGYDARWTVLGAHHVGAPHKRDRLWVVAQSQRKRLEKPGLVNSDISVRSSPAQPSEEPQESGGNVADTHREGSQEWSGKSRQAVQRINSSDRTATSERPVKPHVGLLVARLASKLDRPGPDSRASLAGLEP